MAQTPASLFLSIFWGAVPKFGNLLSFYLCLPRDLKTFLLYFSLKSILTDKTPVGRWAEEARLYAWVPHLVINAGFLPGGCVLEEGGAQSQKLCRCHAKVAQVVSIFWEERWAVFAGSITASFKQIWQYIVKLNDPNAVSIYLKNYMGIIKGLGVVGEAVLEQDSNELEDVGR